MIFKIKYHVTTHKNCQDLVYILFFIIEIVNFVIFHFETVPSNVQKKYNDLNRINSAKFHEVLSAELPPLKNFQRETSSRQFDVLLNVFQVAKERVLRKRAFLKDTKFAYAFTGFDAKKGNFIYVGPV